MGFGFTLAAEYKDNMTDIRAALGIHHLKKQDRFIEPWLAMSGYDEAFARDDPGVMADQRP